jgi:lysophospholipase L1-like esterase
MPLKKIFIPLFGLVLILFGSSIVLNFLLFNQAKKYYFELNETRLDPVGLSYYLNSPGQHSVANQSRVVFFGDSRAKAWIPPKISGYEFINRGISSQTSVQVIQRFTQDVRPLQPKVIIIQVGINDLKTIALFPDRKASIVANCRSNIEKIVKESRESGAIVILTTIFPVGDVPLERRPFWSDEVGQAVKDMNTYLTTLAGDRIIVFDAFSLLADRQGMMMSEYQIDELHLNVKGYEILNQGLVKQLEAIK